MGKRGPDETISDERLLLELVLADDKSVFASEIEPHVPIGKTRIRQRLNDLVDEGLVGKRTASGRNLYRLTEKGKEYISESLREDIT